MYLLFIKFYGWLVRSNSIVKLFEKIWRELELLKKERENNYVFVRVVDILKFIFFFVEVYMVFIIKIVLMGEWKGDEKKWSIKIFVRFIMWVMFMEMEFFFVIGE